MNQKGFLTLAITFVLIIVVLSGIFIYKNNLKNVSLPVNSTDSSRSSPFPSPYDKIEKLDNGLTRYISYKYNYQVDIPLNWQVFSQDGNLRVSDSAEKETLYGQDFEVLGMTVTPNKVTSSLLKSYEPYSTFPEHTNYKIDGYPSIKRNMLPKLNTEPVYAQSYLIRKENKLFYEISFVSAYLERINKNQANIDKIIKSFKFLNRDDQKITTLTYKNADLQFSFNYPSNWLVNTFQNNGDYNKGFTLINEDDGEMITMFEQGRYGNCPSLAPNKEVNFAGEKVSLNFDCDHPRVKTISGREFNMNINFYGSEWEKQGQAVLNSIKGLKVIR